MKQYTIKEMLDILNRNKYHSYISTSNNIFSENSKIDIEQKYKVAKVVTFDDKFDIYCLKMTENRIIYNNIKYLIPENMNNIYTQYKYQDCETKNISKYVENTFWWVKRTINLLEEEERFLDAEFIKFFYSAPRYFYNFNPVYHNMITQIMGSANKTKFKIDTSAPYYEVLVDKETQEIKNVYGYLVVYDSYPNLTETKDEDGSLSKQFFINKMTIYACQDSQIFYELGYKNFKYTGQKNGKYVCENIDLAQILDYISYLSNQSNVYINDIKAPIIYDIDQISEEYVSVEL